MESNARKASGQHNKRKYVRVQRLEKRRVGMESVPERQKKPQVEKKYEEENKAELLKLYLSTDIDMRLRRKRFDGFQVHEDMDADVKRQNYYSAHITESLHKTLMPPEVYRALTSGDFGFFEQDCLKNNRDLESCVLQVSSDEDTVLHIAARLGQDRIVCLIFERFHGLKLSEHENYVGNLPLHEAVNAGHLSTVKILLSPPALASTSSAPADNSTSSYASKILRHKNKEKDSVLHLALRNRHKEVAYFLFETDSVATHDLNMQQQSPLHMAAEAGYEDLFKLMMDYCFSTEKNNPEDILKERNQRSRLVHVAISGKNRGILGAVLDKWPGFIETEGEWKLRIRPLSHAAFIGYLDGVNDILDKSTESAYLEEKWSGMYPIHMACSRGHVHILEVFLERCPASRELRSRKHDHNILHVAAFCGSAKAVSHILKIPQIDMLINEKDCQGNTPLHLATRNAHPKVVSIMLWDSRVDLNLVNQIGMTALDVAENYNENVALFRQRLTWQALRYAGANRARRQSMVGMMNQYSNSNRQGRQNMDFYKDRVNTLMLVSILVVTIAFAAGFISPQHFDTSESKEGTPTTLFQNCVFVLFVISNTIAFYTSITVVVALIWSQLGDVRLVLASLKYTVPVLGVSLAMVSVAFMTGVYLVVRKNTWLAILVLVIGSIGFLILFVLFAPLYSPSSLKHRLARHIFYYPFCLLIKVTHSDVDDNSKEV